MRSEWSRSAWMAVAAGALAVLSLSGAGCGRMESGVSGLVAFTPAVSQAEVTGLDAPVARGATLLVRLAPVDPARTTAALTLEATGLDGNEVQVVPAGIGVWGLHVPDVGRVRISAIAEGEEIDSREVEVRAADAIGLSDDVLLETTADGCTITTNARLGEVVLAPNQRLRTVVVPRVEGRAMLGLLPLEAEAHGAVVRALSQADDVPALSLEVELEPGWGATSMTQPIELRVRDTANALDVRRRIATQWTDAAVAECRTP